MHAAMLAWGCMDDSMVLQGVIVAFRVVDGALRKGDVVRLMNTKKEYQVDEVGVRSPTPIEVCCFKCFPCTCLSLLYVSQVKSTQSPVSDQACCTKQVMQKAPL